MTFNRLKNTVTNMEVSKLFLRNIRTANLSAKESSYQMGFDTYLTLPQTESVQNFDTYGVLPSAKDELIKVLQNFVRVNL